MEAEPKTYQLPTQTLPGLNLSDNIADLVKIKELLNNRGISTKNTRIERYIQYLTEVISEGPKNESLVFKNSTDARFKSSTDWMLYVLREVHELTWILRGLKVHIPAGLDSKLETLVSGSDFAALDTNSHSRNVQFELRIASYFCQAGCEVDLTTNTDIIALSDKFAFFVECKRIGSMSQLQGRLKEAAKQLKRRMPLKHGSCITFGVIAADVTKVAFNHNGITWALTPEHSKDVIQTKLRHIANILNKTHSFYDDPKIIRHWLQIHIPSLIINPPSTVTRFSNYYIENFMTDKSALIALKSLHDVDAIATRPDEREEPPRKLIPRTSFTFPIGTDFQTVNDALLRDLLKCGQLTGIEKTHVVANLTINGFKHEFTLQELEMFVASTPKAKMDCLAVKTMKARVQLVIEMYMRRYPYEDNETEAKR